MNPQASHPTPYRARRSSFLFSARSVASLLVLAAAGCDSSSGDPGGVAGSEKAIIIALDSPTPESNVTLVGAFSELPTGELDQSKMIALPGYNTIRAQDGYVFIYSSEQTTMTRYAISDDMRLVEPVELSFQAFAGGGGSLDVQLRDRETGYGSSTEVVAEFDPSTMLIGRNFPISLPAPVVPSGLDSGYGNGKFAGAVVWNVYGNDFGALTFNDQAMLGFLEPGASQVTVISEPRCAPNLKNFLVDGDIYVVGAGTNAEYIRNYDALTTSAPNCILRVKAGTRAFDPSYFVDLTEITKSPAIEIVTQFDRENLIFQYWDPEVPMPADGSEYYSTPAFKTMKVNMLTGATEPLDALYPRGIPRSYYDYPLDGTNYIPVYEAPYGTGTTLQHVEDGALKTDLHSTGAITYIARAR